MILFLELGMFLHVFFEPVLWLRIFLAVVSFCVYVILCTLLEKHVNDENN